MTTLLDAVTPALDIERAELIKRLSENPDHREYNSIAERIETIDKLVTKYDVWGIRIVRAWEKHSAWSCNNWSCEQHPASMYHATVEPINPFLTRSEVHNGVMINHEFRNSNAWGYCIDCGELLSASIHAI